MKLLVSRVKAKHLQFYTAQTSKNAKIKDAFKDETGAIDLASIMVGIIVIGLIGGVIAATVFVVIPWMQDNAAKQQLDSIVAAQSAYMGLSSDSPPALPAGHKANSFGDSASLASANLLQTGSTYCTVITNAGKGYQGLAHSASGKVWSATNSQTKPTNLGVGSITDDCSMVGAVYIDPAPTTTTLTYKCATTRTGVMPLQSQLNGTETWTRTDGVPVSNAISTYNGANTFGSSKTLEANVEYQLTFEGTYKTVNSNSSIPTRNLSSCVRSLDHWGVNTGVTNASYAFFNSTNLVSVPAHIPVSITNMASMFSGASVFNGDISSWDVSNVNNMSYIFYNAHAFNQDISSWNVSNVNNMSYMFYNAHAFNQDISSWNVSNVTNMEYMFYSARVFNQDISRWNVSKAINMQGMFSFAWAFNQKLSSWIVGQVTNYSDFETASGIANKPEYMPKFSV